MDFEENAQDIDEYVCLDEVYTESGHYEEVEMRNAEKESKRENMLMVANPMEKLTQKTESLIKSPSHMNQHDTNIPREQISSESQPNLEHSGIYSKVKKYKKISKKIFDKYQKVNVSSKMTILWLTFAISSLWVITIIFIAVVSSKISQLHIELKSNANASTTNLFKQFQVQDSIKQTDLLYGNITILKEMFKSYQNNNSAEIAATMKILNESIHASAETATSLKILNESIRAELALIKSIALGPGKTMLYPALSCAAIVQADPSSLSDYYWVMASNGSAVHVYCDMTALCDSDLKGWQKIAEVNMTNPDSECPYTLCRYAPSHYYYAGSTDWCGICMSGECSSFTFATTTEYSHVCGKIILSMDQTWYYLYELQSNAMTLHAGSQTIWSSNEISTPNVCPCVGNDQGSCQNFFTNCKCNCFNEEVDYHTSGDFIMKICDSSIFHIGISYLDIYIQ